MPATGARSDVVVPDGVDLGRVLGHWRGVRRRRRLTEVHWIDALYRAYLAALVSGGLFLAAASATGDEPARLAADDLARAPAVLGVAAAAVLFIGLRSGSRGGPLALEAAEVRHALGAPVDRSAALRVPAIRQLRFLTFAAAVVGAAAGHLADRRLDGNGAAWLACGALFAVVSTLLAHGVAAVVSGRRLPAPVATGLAMAVLAASVADALGALPYAPATAVGEIALWPLAWDPVGLAAVAASIVAVAAGLGWIGGTSLERLERRARLVGQIRFAATLQDLRTVIVLRRQLTQERARTRPWLRLRLPARRAPVLVRDVRSLLRWPSGRAMRLAVVAVIAGLSGRAAFDGTSAMVVVAGLALFLGGLDAAEPLGQEVDHPSARDAVPVPAGVLYAWHLPVVAAVSVGLAAVAAGIGVLVDPVAGAWPVAAACIVPAALGAAAGATVNVLMGAPDPAGAAGGAWSLAPPEAAGMRLLFRLVWPPALAIFGMLPVLVARAALDDGRGAAEAALAGFLPGVGVFGLVAGWARYRDDIRRWWSAQLGQVFPDRSGTGTAADG